METRANYIIVGIFTLAALLAAFFFVYWTAQYGDTGETAAIEVRITGSAAGLGRGSQVLFNGVRIGDVRDVRFDRNDPGVAVATAVVDRSAPITASTRATIGIQGLTGQSYVEFSGGDPKQPSVFDVADEANMIPTVAADPSAVTNILETVQSIAARADRILDGLEEVVGDARGPLTQSMQNIQKFSQALSDNSESVDEFLRNFTQLSQELGTVSGKLGTTLDSANELITAIDREKVNQTVANVQSFTERLDRSTQNIDQITAGLQNTLKTVETFAGSATRTSESIERFMADVDSAKVGATIDAANKLVTAIDSEKVNQSIASVQAFTQRLDRSTQNIDQITAGLQSTLKTVETFASSAGKTAEEIEKLLADVDSGKIRTTVDNIASASENAKSVAEEARKLTARVTGRGDDIDATITNARQLSEKLNAASTRIDGVLAKLDGLLGEGGGNDLIAEARDTLVSFRNVADNLNTRIDRISGGLEKFSGRGLDQVEALVQESRRSIQRIERAVADLERNPQRIISGGEGTVRRYDGRARR